MADTALADRHGRCENSKVTSHSTLVTVSPCVKATASTCSISPVPAPEAASAIYAALTLDGTNYINHRGGMWDLLNLGSLDLLETISATSLYINVVSSAFVTDAAPKRDVPEPPSLVMLATSLLGLAGITKLRRLLPRRRRRTVLL